jgi:hypothetical protein
LTGLNQLALRKTYPFIFPFLDIEFMDHKFVQRLFLTFLTNVPSFGSSMALLIGV